MDSRSTGLLVVACGIIAVVVGLLIATGGLGWFGRLPGDIRVERGSTRFYLPLTSMLLVSIVLSIALSLLRRL